MPLATHDRTPEQEANIKQANDSAEASRKALQEAEAAIGRASQEGHSSAGKRTPEQEAQIAKAGEDSNAARAAAEVSLSLTLAPALTLP